MRTIGFVMAVMLLLLAGCAAQTDMPAESGPVPVQAESAAPDVAADEEARQQEAAATEEVISETGNTGSEDIMRLWIGETEVPVTWEENASVEALRALCPVTIQMSMYGGFEQVGSLGQSIVRDDVQTGTSCGDIVLYSGSQIVIFYGSNSWAYTRLGHVELSQQEMSELLGKGDVSITLK